ncbi:MAG: tRNA lysidine(34) synthetase TilS [Lachnospiraceae bacterium]|nr:tRNA lysidine(34) synthetase TilS [Lachnospiraceae bacterium]
MIFNIKTTVKSYIKANRMICVNEHVCVAVSGGADSMCLLFLMKEIAEEEGFSLSAVHVEHGIRGEDSMSDMKYVENQCKNMHIPLKTFRIDAPALSIQTGTSLEEAARNERYRLFNSINADKIALAHHMNDQAETVLFNLIRGTGLKGLKGIAPLRGKYIRPLLCLKRSDIEDYCNEKNIRYRHDITNDDTDLSRNLIRHNVLPQLENVNIRTIDHICSCAEELSETDAFLEELTTETAQKLVEFDNGIARIDLNDLLALHPVLSARVIKKTLIRISGRAKDITRKHIEAVLSIAKGQSGRQTAIIYGIKARKEFKELIITGPGHYETDSTPLYTPEICFEIIERRLVSDEEITKDSTYTKLIDYATIKDTADLSIRHRHPGDRISIRNGTKKLKDLLIEEKIPAKDRDKLFVVALHSEVIWIPGIGRIGERFKITDSTKQILRMEIKNGR